MTPQGPLKVPELSDQEFNELMYPISRGQKSDYEAARKELQLCPESEAARARLAVLAGQGYLPALRDLTSSELKRGDLLKATHLSLTAARLGDPVCAITLANLYSAQDEYEDHDQTTQRDNAVHQWLRCASLKRIVYDQNTLAPIGVYTNPFAKKYARTFLQEKQEQYEEMISQCMPEQLHKRERDAMNGELLDIPFNCYLIKKNSEKGTHEPAKRALSLAEKIIHSHQFDDDYLHAAGVRSAIERLCNHANQTIQKRAKKLCDDWDDKESRLGKIVHASAAIKTKKKFEPNTTSEQLVNDLLLATPSDFEGADCVDAALYLHAIPAHTQAIAAAVSGYLDHAMLDTDHAARRALIEKCRQDNELAAYSVRALSLYASELQANNGLLQEEVDFMNRELKMCMNRADRGNDEAALEAYYLMTSFPDFFSSIPMEKRKAAEDKYFHKAFSAGNYTALCTGARAARSFKLETSADFVRAIKFWSIAYNVASAQSASFAKDLPAPAELAAEAYQNVLELAQKKREKGEETSKEEAEFYFYLTSGFANINAQQAFRAFFKAAQIVSHLEDRDAAELFEKAGMKALLEDCKKRGKGWANFANGFYVFIQSINPPKNMSNEDHYKYIINEMHKARGYLKLAADAAEPYSDSIFTDADIDAQLGTQYYNLYCLNKAERRPYCGTALIHLKKAADQSNATGLLEWANITLSGEGDKGQSALIQSVNYLMKAASQADIEPKDSKLAFESLEKMESGGLFYTSGCDGVMTLDLLHKIQSFLKKHRKNVEAAEPSVQPIDIDPVFDPAQEYASMKERADQGDIKAMVATAVLFRDGTGIEKSNERSEEYFIKALMAWDGLTDLGNAITFAYKSLENSGSRSLEASVALTKALFADASILGSLNFIPGNPIHNQRVAENRNILIKRVAHTQALMLISKNPEDKNLFFTSGLASLIAERCNPLTEGNFLVELSNLYIQRMRAFPEEIAVESEKQMLLFKPIFDMEHRLKDALFHEDFKHQVKNEELIKMLNSFTDNLSAFIKVSSINRPRLEYLLALCHSYRAIKSRASLAEPLSIFKRLTMQGNVDAEYMIAYLTLYGNELNPAHMPANHDQGIVLLEQLGRQKKHIEALLILSEYFIEKSESAEHPKQAVNLIKKAEKYLIEILKINNKNADALLSLAEIYFYNPKIKPLELQEEETTDSARNNYIHALLAKARGSKKQIDSRVYYFQALLALRSDTISQEVLKEWEELLLAAETNDDIASLLNDAYRRKNLAQQIDTWCDACCAKLRSSETDDFKISRIYSIGGWVHTLIARLTHLEKYLKGGAVENIIKDAAQRANALLQKATSCQRVTPGAHAIKLSLILGVEKAGDDAYWENSKKTIARTVEIMQKEGLTMGHVPLFQKILAYYIKIVELTRSPEVCKKETDYINSVIENLS